jgi:hypothetical protein
LNLPPLTRRSAFGFTLDFILSARLHGLAEQLPLKSALSQVV